MAVASVRRKAGACSAMLAMLASVCASHGMPVVLSRGGYGGYGAGYGGVGGGGYGGVEPAGQASASPGFASCCFTTLCRSGDTLPTAVGWTVWRCAGIAGRLVALMPALARVLRETDVALAAHSGPRWLHHR